MRPLDMFTGRTLAEGLAPLAVLAVVIAAALWLRWWPVAVVALLLLVFTVSFFRDPRRVIPADPQTIVAPADGRVVEITPTETGTMIGIFLSVFDVHVQRAPVAGVIRSVQYVPGRFLDARNPQAGPLNERRVTVLESDAGDRVEVRQIAGLIARRIVGWAGEGARVAKGDRLGMIRFGSRVELYLPAGMEITVQVGARAVGGETIVARKH